MARDDFGNRLPLGQGGDDIRYRTAREDFNRAKQRATMEYILGRLKGRSPLLLDYNEVADALRVTGQVKHGVRTIPVSQIVGSVGRYKDFTRSFLPRFSWDQDRWARVKTAARHVSELPPIDVYQIGDAYFVLDGNHRVSIAKETNVEFLDARVVEIRTRVPFTADSDPDLLIISAEYAAFLEFTRLDTVRPEADLRVTAPGQYTRLENLIEVNRYFLEEAEGDELSDREAVTRWYDDVYLPVVIAFREQGILRDFPHRTETDLFAWLSTHQAALRRELGWEARPDAAVTQLIPQLKRKPQRLVTRVYNRVLEAVSPASWRHRVTPPAANTWMQRKTLDRYSQSLFADILAPLPAETEAVLLQQAIHIAQKENGRLVGLRSEETPEAAVVNFQTLCQAAPVAHVFVEDGCSLATMVRRRAPVADLLLLDGTLATAVDVDEFLQSCYRPVWVVGAQVAPAARALLVTDRADSTALFIAAYLAEQWGTRLTLLQATGAAQEATQAYLAMHEVTVETVVRPSLTPEALLAAAVAQQFDVVVVDTVSAVACRELLSLPASAAMSWLFCP
jgi:hypothetical protein